MNDESSGGSLVVTGGGLAELASAIRSEHLQFEHSLRRGLQHALNAGRLLLQAKSMLPHGQWLGWLAENCPFSERTAQRYVRAVERLPELERKASSMTGLGIVDAMRLLAYDGDGGGKSVIDDAFEGDAPGDDGYVPFLEMTTDARRELATRYWDVLASWTAILSADGWDIEEIAETLGQSQDAIRRIVAPEVPAGNRMARAIAAGMLGAAYESAAAVAEREDFSADVAAELEAASRQYSRQEQAAFPGGMLAMMEDTDSYCESWTAARLALGIEQPVSGVHDE
jgi:hypothetical protein